MIDQKEEEEAVKAMKEIVDTLIAGVTVVSDGDQMLAVGILATSASRLAAAIGANRADLLTLVGDIYDIFADQNPTTKDS